MAHLAHIAEYLPKARLINETLASEFPDWSVEKIAKKTGIQSRPIAAENQTAVDLGIGACEQLFKEVPSARGQVDFLIFCTQTPDYLLPTSACLIQERLNLSKHVGAFDMNLGCSGFVYGLAMAKSIVQSNLAKNVLLVCSDTYSKLIKANDKSNRTLFGDAATAALIRSDEGKFRLGEFVFGTDGSGAENLIVRNGGLRNRQTSCEDVLDDDGNFQRNDACLYMNGAKIFSFASTEVPKLYDRLLTKLNLESDQIDRVVLHQANSYMLEHLRRRMRVEKDKFVVHMKELGNTVSSSIPLAVNRELACRPVKAAEQWCLIGFGVGYSSAACMLHAPS